MSEEITALGDAFAKLTTADDNLVANFKMLADQIRATAGDKAAALKLAAAIDAETAKVTQGLADGTISPPAPAPAPTPAPGA